MEVLLTDDEVVALTAAARTAWPYGLHTVAAADEALIAAGLRGLRSLAVRGLATTGTAGRVEYPPELVLQFTDIATAERYALVQVAARDAVAQPRGAMVGAFAVGAAWVTDSVTVSGVHAIRPVTEDEAAELLLRFITEVWENGVLAPGPAEFGLFITSSVSRGTSYFVSRGRTEAFVLSDGGFELPAGVRETPWELADVRAVMSGSG